MASFDINIAINKKGIDGVKQALDGISKYAAQSMAPSKISKELQSVFEGASKRAILNFGEASKAYNAAMYSSLAMTKQAFGYTDDQMKALESGMGTLEDLYEQQLGSLGKMEAIKRELAAAEKNRDKALQKALREEMTNTHQHFKNITSQRNALEEQLKNSGLDVYQALQAADVQTSAQMLKNAEKLAGSQKTAAEKAKSAWKDFFNFMKGALAGLVGMFLSAFGLGSLINRVAELIKLKREMVGVALGLGTSFEKAAEKATELRNALRDVQTGVVGIEDDKIKEMFVGLADAAPIENLEEVTKTLSKLSVSTQKMDFSQVTGEIGRLVQKGLNINDFANSVQGAFSVLGKTNTEEFTKRVLKMGEDMGYSGDELNTFVNNMMQSAGKWGGAMRAVGVDAKAAVGSLMDVVNSDLQSIPNGLKGAFGEIQKMSKSGDMDGAMRAMIKMSERMKIDPVFARDMANALGQNVGVFNNLSKMGPEVEGKLQGIAETMQKTSNAGEAYKTMNSTLMGRLLELGASIEKLIEKALRPVADWLEKVGNEYIPPVITWIENLTKSFENNEAGIVEWITTGALIAGAVAAIAASIWLGIKAFGMFKKSGKEAGESIGETVEKLSGGIMKSMANFGTGVGKLIGGIAKGIGKAFEFILGGIGKGLAAMTPAIPVLLTIAATVASVGVAAAGIGVAFMGAAKAIDSVIGAVERFQKTPIGQAMVKVISASADFLVKLIEMASGFFGGGSTQTAAAPAQTNATQVKLTPEQERQVAANKKQRDQMGFSATKTSSEVEVLLEMRDLLFKIYKVDEVIAEHNAGTKQKLKDIANLSLMDTMRGAS